MKPGDIVQIGGGAGLHEATIKSIDGDRAVVWWPCEIFGRHEFDVAINLLIPTGKTGSLRYPKRRDYVDSEGRTHVGIGTPVPRMDG